MHNITIALDISVFVYIILCIMYVFIEIMHECVHTCVLVHFENSHEALKELMQP